MKLSKIPAPAVAGCVREKTVKAAIAEIKNCYYDGADMIDLHITCLEDMGIDNLKKVISSTKLPVLALNYNQRYDRTKLGMTEEERVESLLRAVEAGAAGIDLQGYTYHAPSESAFYGENKYSFTENNPEVDLVRFLKERDPDIIKIVTKAVTPADCDEAIRTMTVLKREFDFPVSYHASGKAGVPSRLINPLLGGQIAFCIDRYNEGSTMEQLDLRTVRAAVDNARKVM